MSIPPRCGERVASHPRAAFDGRDVGCDVMHARRVAGHGTCGCDNLDASLDEGRDDRRADALRTSCDQRAAVFQFEIETHGAISSRVMSPPARVKRKRS